MAVYFLLVLSVLVNVGMALLLRRSVRINLQFDEIFEHVAPTLEAYSEELEKTLKGGLLEDHPEVAAFHRLNMRNLAAIRTITATVTATRPKPQRPTQVSRPPIVMD